MGFEALSGRQGEVVVLLARGLTNPEIARALGITESTVSTHVRFALRTWGITNRTELAVLALRRGLVDLETAALAIEARVVMVR